MNTVYKWNDEAKKLFDNKTDIGVWLDDCETWSSDGYIVCLNDNDPEHEEVINGDTYIRRSDAKFLSLKISAISKEDMEYLFNKYGSM